MMLRNYLIAALLVAGTVPAMADVQSTERASRELPIYIGGTFVLENTAGDIEIIGVDGEKVLIDIEKVVRASDKNTLEEGVQQTVVRFAGDEKMRVVQTMLPPPVLPRRWLTTVKYNVRVPRTVHVKVVTTTATRIRVADIRGNVYVKSFDGQITLQNITGPSTVDTANGNVLFIAPARSLSNATLTTVNGNIEVRAPRDANFVWVGDTIGGDVRTSFAARASFMGSRFRASINAPGGPTLTTLSIMGTLSVLQSPSNAKVQSLLAADQMVIPNTPTRVAVNRVAQDYIQDEVRGTLAFSTLQGNIGVTSVHGNVDVKTGAGEIRLGSVYGNCAATSNGGPLTLGDILGTLTARTEAGDVLVQAARNGGTIITGGGTIRLLYTGGDTRLQSGGGDIVVRQAAGAITADTRSGDISITLDSNSKTEKVTAKSAKGNVRLNVAPGFAADIDATVITSDPDNNNVTSDIPGLEFRREQVGGKTKIRATGKVNGGGDRVELYAEDGAIQISTRAGAPITILSP